MKIRDEIRKAVGFIAYEDQKNGRIVPVGTFFFLGHDPESNEAFSRKVYAVTARHVIDALRCRGVENLVLRLNPKEPDTEIISKRVALTQWFMHPSDNSIDGAVCEMGVTQEEDHLVIPLS